MFLEAELRALENLEPGWLDRCLSPGLRAALAEAGELGWIPAELFVGFLDAVLEVIGDDQLLALYQAALLSAAASPLLRVTSESAIRLFGPRGVVLGLVPAWGLVARDCAQIRTTPTINLEEVEEVIVEFAELPGQLGTSWAWNAVCRATLQASIEGAGLVGLVEQQVTGEPDTLRFCMYVRAGRSRRVAG